jgi:hypothetical protein
MRAAIFPAAATATVSSVASKASEDPLSTWTVTTTPTVLAVIPTAVWLGVNRRTSGTDTARPEA